MSPAPTLAPAQAPAALEAAAIRKATRRLMPFLFLLYVFNFLDRTNVAIAALQMNRGIGLSAAAYGLGAGIFYAGYVLFEVPANLVLVRVGARRWIGPILMAWGLVGAATMFVRSPASFYLMRFLLGIAEAGFFPGVVYYLSRWFPTEQRARAISRFMVAIPISGVLGGPLGGWLLGLNGRLGLAGWQWLFLIEGLPTVVLGVVALRYLTDRPEDAAWLEPAERAALAERMRREHEGTVARHGHAGALRALRSPTVWLLSIPYLLTVAGGLGYVFWVAIFVKAKLGTTDLDTGLIAGAFALATAAGMLLVGASSDRRGERPLHAAACAAVAAAGAFGAALLPNPLLATLAFSLIQLGVVAYLVPFWCLPTAFLSGEAAAVSIALINSIGNIGGFLGPSLLGWVKNATGGFDGALLAIGGAALVAAGLSGRLGRAGG